jgi:hypothetical protein
MLKKLSILIAATGLLAACAGETTKQSGFLQNYSQLKPDAKIEGASSYRASNLYSYRKFILDPIVVHFAPKAEGAAIEPDKLKELTDYFYNNAIKALSKNYQIVKEPGPGVARLRVAITNIEETNPLLNIHPGTKFTGAGLGGASMEAEAVDSTTNKRLAAIVETARGSRASIGAGLSRLGHAKQVIDGWIERFVKRLDEARTGKKS